MDNKSDLAYAEHFLDEFFCLGPFRDIRQINKKNEGLGFIVGYLYNNRDKAVYAGDLARVSGVSTARIAAALKKLEQLGLIQRAMSEKDYRKTVVSLTSKGVKKAEEGKIGMISYTSRLIEKVGRDDMEELLRILAGIKGAVSELREEGCGV